MAAKTTYITAHCHIGRFVYFFDAVVVCAAVLGCGAVVPVADGGVAVVGIGFSGLTGGVGVGAVGAGDGVGVDCGSI